MCLFTIDHPIADNDLKRAESMSFVSFIESLIPEPRKPIYSFRLVESSAVFKFRKLCPYCKGDLTYRVTGWVEDDFGLWCADLIECDCSTMPDLEGDTQTFNTWVKRHTTLPYSIQLPVDIKVQEWINKRVRFLL